jgi:alkylation response protein AidB-like acyl-CoA dehydrogenase
MNFDWLPAERELYDRALAFARSLHSPRAERESGVFPRDAWTRCGEFGLLGLCVPSELGGTGLDALMTARIFEAFGRGCSDLGLLFAGAAHLFACTMPLAEHGSDALRQALVPRLARGELIGANAITEAEAGSDVFALKMQAVLHGDHYVLNGIKSYVTNGPAADVFLVYAQTNPHHGFLGLSAFAVEKGMPGVSCSAPFRKVGLHSAPTSTVYFEDCHVPVSHLLAEEGQGALIFQSSMAWERACLFGIYVGAMERDLERGIAYGRDRRQFGRPIGKNQAISHRIANMKLRLEAARLLLYKACSVKDSGEEATMDVSLAKLAISESAIQSGLDVIQIHGSSGVTTETGIADSLLDALPSTIFSGSSEMQRDLVAKALGL